MIALMGSDCFLNSVSTCANVVAFTVREGSGDRQTDVEKKIQPT